MTTLTLEVAEEQMRLLVEDAEQQGLIVEELALLRVLLVHSPAEQGSGMDFEAAIEYVFQKNTELYERLADRKERVSEAIKRIIDRNEEPYRRLA